MIEQRHEESREHWRDVWLAMEGSESHDVWYAVDEAKMAYLRPYLPESGRCLEVGCGTARLSRFLARRGYEVVGVDYEPEALKLAQRRIVDDGVEIPLALGDAFALPFADGSFDVVLSTGLLEHFAHPSPIVDEMTRVLKPRGLFYSDIVPRKFALMRLFEALTRHPREVWDRPFSRGQIGELLRESGLTVKTVFAAGILPPPLPLVGRWRFGKRLEDRAARAFIRLSSRLDGTSAAERLGIYYFACALKLNEAGAQARVNESIAAGRAA